jgi:cation diffusion facilitator family transporter
MGDALDLYRESRRAAAWGLVLSVALGAVKLLAGLFGHSLALVSDAAHSLGDAAVSVTLIVALRLAQRPADKEHPYGHGRVEALAGSVIALVLLGLALAIVWGSLATVGRSHPRPHGYTLAVAAGGALLQEALYRYVGRVARRTGSRALLAAAWDYRLDALSGVGVAVGVALARWGGPAWAWADHAAALAVAATILWVGGELLWDNAQALMDRQADPAVLDAVRREALAVPGVLGVEKLRVRKAGLEYLVDIHVEVDPELTVRAGHDIAHAVKDRVMRSAGPIRDVLVHIEPPTARADVSGPTGRPA